MSASKSQTAAEIDTDLKDWQLNRANLSVGDELGHGFFGAVLNGWYVDEKGETQRVAIKSLHMPNDESSPEASKQRRIFLLEAQILAEFRNPHGTFP